MDEAALESLMSDPRWNPFWFLRCCANIGGRKRGKRATADWQVWDFSNDWDPFHHKTSLLIVPAADSAVEACQMALESLRPKPRVTSEEVDNEV